MRAAIALLLILGLGGCRSCTRRECEQETLIAHCEGSTLKFCAREGSSWGIDFGTRKVSEKCGAKDVCIDDHHGQAACVHAPATRCQGDLTGPASCDGDDVIMCTAPSIRVNDSYLVTAHPCFAGTHCVPGTYGGTCVENKK